MAVQLLGRSVAGPQLNLPLFIEGAEASQDAAASVDESAGIDLNQLCLRYPERTFFVAVETDAMIDAGIAPGDVLIAHQAQTARSGQIVIASVQGELTVRELQLSPSPRLIAHHPDMETFVIPDSETLTILGIVTQVLRSIGY
ncbi:S24 family peptidase [Saccharospirillum mangrovi]|uniref:S24 family peptidase n=1 Tax=Saccharospirillum mangrovi TaxID=2161747 RepID=UPI000D389DE7|nr:S24 family peptidase [Saccharospirillum mangrovi]